MYGSIENKVNEILTSDYCILCERAANDHLLCDYHYYEHDTYTVGRLLDIIWTLADAYNKLKTEKE